MRTSELVAALGLAICIVVGPNADAQGVGDVQWCLTTADKTIFQQPQTGYCPWVATGAAVGTWFSQTLGSYVLNKTQRGWSRDAATLSCGMDPQSMSWAIGMIAACQCHNKGAADWILAHPNEVLYALRSFANCQAFGGGWSGKPANFGTPEPPQIVTKADICRSLDAKYNALINKSNVDKTIDGLRADAKMAGCVIAW